MAGVVTAKAPSADWSPVSVALTVVPEVPEGTLKVHVNDPVGPVVSEPLKQDKIALASKTRDDRGTDSENPVPDTVVVAPTGPWVGVTEIARAVTVNACTAVSVLDARSSPSTE